MTPPRTENTAQRGREDLVRDRLSILETEIKNLSRSHEEIRLEVKTLLALQNRGIGAIAVFSGIISLLGIAVYGIVSWFRSR